ncbi:MAG: hypothetical protein ACKOEM_00845 [Planctomycetia bacterium]
MAALAGSDIQTNPPATNRAADDPTRTFTRCVDRLPPPEVLVELDAKVDMPRLETALMEEGVEKFVAPQKALLALIAAHR